MVMAAMAGKKTYQYNRRNFFPMVDDEDAEVDPTSKKDDVVEVVVMLVVPRRKDDDRVVTVGLMRGNTKRGI